jgi:hypothetical protein
LDLFPKFHQAKRTREEKARRGEEKAGYKKERAREGEEGAACEEEEGG